jgi:BirA family transcriptional regulator, biotin operon repressor / biotin---[acetyl-CoA-carboxylase] ligase
MTAHDSSVLRLLADGEFHSGAGLARALGVSRSTVWNAVHALSAAGLDVYRVKSRGYRLAQPLSLLDTSAIVRHAGTAASRFAIDLIDTAGSTNTLLLQRAAAGTPTGSVVMAEWQRSGRGRMQREWHAAIGGAITFSVLWRFTHGAAALAGLSLAVGVALTRAIARLGASDVQLKWPNDVLWRERKLGGVLIEMQGDALGPSAAVIGIGMNVRLSDSVRERIGQPATDLEAACGCVIDRSAAVGFILAELASVLDTFSTGGFAPLREEWLRSHAFDGKRVVVKLPNGRNDEGIIRGVDENGALLFDDGTGSRRLHSAEISVRRAQSHSRDRHTTADPMPRPR